VADEASSAVPHAELYREIALAIRALLPLLQHSDIKAELAVLAIRYEKLALYVEAAATQAQGDLIRPDIDASAEGRRPFWAA
jgi:hypothetical protein